MTVKEGDKGLCIPTSQGSYVFLPAAHPAVGDRVICYPLESGGYYAVPMTAPEQGSTIIAAPYRGGYIMAGAGALTIPANAVIIGVNTMMPPAYVSFALAGPASRSSMWPDIISMIHNSYYIYYTPTAPWTDFVLVLGYPNSSYDGVANIYVDDALRAQVGPATQNYDQFHIHQSNPSTSVIKVTAPNSAPPSKLWPHGSVGIHQFILW